MNDLGIVVGCDYDSKAVHFAMLEREALHLFRYHIYSGQTSLELLDALEACFRSIPLPIQLVVIETPIYIQNPKTSFALNRIYLLVGLACEKLKLVTTSLGSSRWKKLALGYARLNKREVFERMRQRFGEIISDSHYADCTGLALAGRELLKGKEIDAASTL